MYTYSYILVDVNLGDGVSTKKVIEDDKGGGGVILAKF